MVMFFGLTNSPATFQWMMNDIFKDLIASGAIMVYLDDILIMSKTKEEHHCITCEVLKVLQKNKLFLKAEKCEFETLETEYLGVIISEGSIHMDPVKIAGIVEWPMPARKQQLQLFLGFTNFYRRFIKGYSKVVKPMTQLTGNDLWKWGSAQQGAFEELKRLLAKEVVLAIPTEKGKFRVEADASEGAIGAVLSQEQDWKMVPSHLSIQVPHSYRTKLRNLRQRTTRDHARTGRMAALPNGSSSGVRNLDRSSESPVLLKAPKAQSTASPLGHRVGRVPLLSSPQTRNGKQES